MTQNTVNPDITRVTGESSKTRLPLRQMIAKLGRLLGVKLITLITQSTFVRQDDVCIQLSQTTIKVRILNSPLSPQERRDLAIATGQYIVRGLRTGALPEVVKDQERPAAHSKNPVEEIYSEESAGKVLADAWTCKEGFKADESA